MAYNSKKQSANSKSISDIQISSGPPSLDLETLLIAYFSLASSEDYPNSVELTKTLDGIEGAVRDIRGMMEKESKIVKKKVRVKPKPKLQ
jgi:hypothetical protein